MLTANLQAAVRVMVGTTDDPAELLTRWNQLICHNTTPSKFITCVLALLDPASRRIRVSSAGHMSPLIIRENSEQISELDVATGFPLGVVEDAEYESTDCDVGADPFTMFCFSDGVTEAMNGAGEMFGTAGLMRVLAEKRDLNPQGLVKQVRKGVATFVGEANQSDDITILAAKCE